MTLGERTELQKIAGNVPVDLYHLERISSLLDTPINYGIRFEFLQIRMTDEEIIAFYSQRDKDHLAQLAEVTEALNTATQEIINHQTGGDSLLVFGLRSHSGLHNTHGQIEISGHIQGKYSLFDVTVTITRPSKNGFPQVEQNFNLKVTVQPNFF